jgi:hypothetical protein
MKVEVGSYVRIAGEYPANRNLQSQTGYVEALPDEEHPNEYLVKLDGGVTISPHLAGKLVKVPTSSLEVAR